MSPLRSAGASLLINPAIFRSTACLTTISLVSVYNTSAGHYSTMSASDSPEDVQGGQKAMLARHRAKEQGNAGGQPRGNWFPLGYKEGFSQWWASLTPAVTEHRVLSFIPYLERPPLQTQTGLNMAASNNTMPIDKSNEGRQVVQSDKTSDPYGPRRWSSTLVQLADKNRALNEFSVSRPDQEADNNLVMLHGYGAGLGFFYKNYEPLSRLSGWRLYALDLLGMGRSSRPPFKIHAKDREARTREAESWFIDALEEWRIKKGIDKMTLLGHSLGGYMAVCYALKYPGHLNKLILASPVGIPEDPFAVSEAAPEPESSSMANEFTQSQDETTKQQTASKTTQPQPRKLPRWLVAAWDANVSPFSLVRLSGPLGPRLVSGWTSRRFSHLPAEESQALHDYSYSLFRQRGSGEYALTYVLAPGAYARSPLIRRIQGVGRQYVPAASSSKETSASSDAGIAQRLQESGVPVVFLYGDNDWMDVKGGYAAAEKLNDERQKALSKASDSSSRLKEIGEAKVIVINKSGHHVYLDGCDQFNEVVLQEMKDVETTQRRLAKL